MIPFWFSTEKSYFLQITTAGRIPLVVVEVVFRLRRELGEKTLGDLSEVSRRLLIRGAESLFTQNNIPNRQPARPNHHFLLIVA